MATVLVPFPFAGNGYTVEYLNVGDTRDFGAATEGLATAGMISVDAVVVEDEVAATVQVAQITQKRPFQKRR